MNCAAANNDNGTYPRNSSNNLMKAKAPIYDLLNHDSQQYSKSPVVIEAGLDGIHLLSFVSQVIETASFYPTPLPSPSISVNPPIQVKYDILGFQPYHPPLPPVQLRKISLDHHHHSHHSSIQRQNNILMNDGAEISDADSEESSHTVESASFTVDGSTESCKRSLKPKRKRANARQLAILNKVFQLSAFPSAAVRCELGKQLAMAPRTVQIWFQNKRQMLKMTKPKDFKNGSITIAEQLVEPLTDGVGGGGGGGGKIGRTAAISASRHRKYSLDSQMVAMQYNNECTVENVRKICAETP